VPHSGAGGLWLAPGVTVLFLPRGPPGSWRRGPAGRPRPAPRDWSFPGARGRASSSGRRAPPAGDWHPGSIVVSAWSVMSHTRGYGARCFAFLPSDRIRRPKSGRLDAVDQGTPDRRAQDERAAVRVLAVTDSDGTNEAERDLDTVAAVGGGAAVLAPDCTSQIQTPQLAS
jgi:hypothetical protein